LPSPDAFANAAEDGAPRSNAWRQAEAPQGAALAPDKAIWNSPASSRGEAFRPDSLATRTGTDVAIVGNQSPQPMQPTIHITSLATYLPTAILREAGNAVAESNANAALARQPTSVPGSQGASALKVLNFQIEPASLGAISVKMRVTQSRIELQIDAQSPATSALIANTHERLAAAIRDNGFVLDSFKIHVDPGLTSSAAPQDGHFAGGQAGNSGQQGYANEDRSGQRQRESAPHREAPRRDERHSAGAAVGVIL
jgi:flagellar hook-length control protein FliK